MLVFDDAEMNRAVEGAVRGCFTNAGQLCLSFERLYVQAGVYDQFLRQFTERTRTLSMAPSPTSDNEIGSLVSEAQFEKVKRHVEDAVEKGATVIAGGTTSGNGGSIELVMGDITRRYLGIREDGESLQNDTREMFHLAAVYDLAVSRDVGMAVNVEGTRNVLDFANGCPNLERFQYVTT
ncbi:aldehyde dehydrogenase family protein [Haladaptatus sp. DFWS20]|uniref:aldehyde dehydrogenase family protein n=1 Tax=Haladaptatus sp. DFWS20 TaxID=3403467 RepID=UPI003EBFFCF5